MAPRECISPFLGDLIHQNSDKKWRTCLAWQAAAIIKIVGRDTHLNVQTYINLTSYEVGRLALASHTRPGSNQDARRTT
eukprot:4109240-Amphidinium_carterae.1